MHKQRFDLIRTGMCLMILSFFVMSSVGLPVVTWSQDALPENSGSTSYRIPLNLLVVTQVVETPTETPVETPTETPEPTDTPEPVETPTNTPEPTATPESPTSTPEPTATPESPTATPEPEPTDTPEPVEMGMSIAEDVEATVGQEFTVKINVENFTNVDAFGFDIVQSNNILTFVSVDTTETLLKDFVMVDASEMNDGAVRISAIGGDSNITGGGLLLKVNYIAEQEGDTELSFANLVDDIEGAELESGEVEVEGETPTATPEPEPTATPETPTSTPEPTDTPEPTATPETPVETPEPTETPEPGATPTPTPTPHVFENSNQGILLVDGFGGIHEVGDIAGFYDLNGNGELDDPMTTRIFPYFPNNDIYRDYEIYVQDGRVSAVMAASGNGMIYSAKFTPSDERVIVQPNFIASLGVQFNSNNVVRDVEFTSNGSGYFALLSDGSIYRVDGNQEQPVQIARAFTDAKKNPAVDFEILEETGVNIDAYILTAKGRVKAIGEAPALVSPVSEIPIFRDMELYEGVAVLANGYGHFFIAAQEGQDDIPDIPLPEDLVFGVDVLEDFEIQVDESQEFYGGLGLVATTSLGTLHTAGAADYFLTEEGLVKRQDGLDIVTREDGTQYIDININFDIVRDLELYILE